jgi:hypothetical protein
LFCPQDKFGNDYFVSPSTCASIGGCITKLVFYFAHSPKKFLQFQKLADLINTKGNKLLQNMKTQWISMLSPTK